MRSSPPWTSSSTASRRCPATGIPRPTSSLQEGSRTRRRSFRSRKKTSSTMIGGAGRSRASFGRVGSLVDLSTTSRGRRSTISPTSQTACTPRPSPPSSSSTSPTSLPSSHSAPCSEKRPTSESPRLKASSPVSCPESYSPSSLGSPSTCLVPPDPSMSLRRSFSS